MGMKARCSLERELVVESILNSGARAKSSVTVFVGLDDRKDSIQV